MGIWYEVSKGFSLKEWAWIRTIDCVTAGLGLLPGIGIGIASGSILMSLVTRCLKEVNSDD